MTVSERSDEGVTQTTDLVFAIAEAKGVDVAELATRLHDVIDTDALEQVLRSADHRTTVTFTYEELQVEVAGDGTFSISGAANDE